MANKGVSLRLGVTGGSEVRAEIQGIATTGEAAFKNLGDEGDKQFRKLSAAAARTATDVEAAQERQNRAMARLTAFAGSNGLPVGGDARAMVDSYVASTRAQDQFEQSLRRTKVSANDNSQGMKQLSFQLNDVATSFAGGVSPMIIFAQQSGQVIQAIQLMTTSTKGFLGFLGGPWGIALTSALVVLTPFVGKLFEESDASKAAKEEAEKHATAIEGLIKAQGDAIITTRRRLALDAAALEIDRSKRAETVRQTIALLEQAKAQAYVNRIQQQAPGQRGENAAIGGMQNDTTAIEEALRAARSQLDQASGAAAIALNKLIADSVASKATREGRMTASYDRERSKILGGGYGNDPAEVTRRLQGLEAWRKREADAIKESEKALKSSTATRDSDTLSATAAAKMLRQALPGVKITSGDRSYAEQKALYDKWVAQGRPANNPTAMPGSSAHNRGNALDVAFGPGLSAEKIREVFAARGIEVSKLLTERGHWHVEWTQGKLALDGYNDAAKRAADESKRAAEAMQYLDDALTRLFPDDGSRQYSTDMMDIGKLSKAGLINDNQRQDATVRAVGLGSTQGLLARDAYANADKAMLTWAEHASAKLPEIVGLMDVVGKNGREALDNVFSVRGLQDFGSAFSRLMESLADDLLQLAIANPLKNLLFGGDAQGGAYPTLGGSGGLIGSLVGGLFGGKGGSNGIVAGDGGVTKILGTIIGKGMPIPKFAAGTNNAPDGWAWVGEDGPELTRLAGGSRVYTAAQSARMGRANNDNGPRNVWNIDARGADEAAVRRLEAMVQRMDREADGRAIAAVANAKDRRMIG